LRGLAQLSAACFQGSGPVANLSWSAFPEIQSPSMARSGFLGGRSVIGSLTGRAIETQDALDFSVLTDVRPMVQTLPLAQAEEAY
jgi:D-arabinose 1-dehydrogenase-like Zn-dependent alcohol dehydrogenase